MKCDAKTFSIMKWLFINCTKIIYTTWYRRHFKIVWNLLGCGVIGWWCGCVVVVVWFGNGVVVWWQWCDWTMVWLCDGNCVIGQWCDWAMVIWLCDCSGVIGRWCDWAVVWLGDGDDATMWWYDGKDATQTWMTQYWNVCPIQIQ